MKTELKNFLKNQLKEETVKSSTQNNFTNISALDSMSTSNYSAF